MIARFVRRNWKVVLFLVLLFAIFVLAPEENLRFIYTEF
jgi:hypothetical protein